jgi:hypothetical protein
MIPKIIVIRKQSAVQKVAHQKRQKMDCRRSLRGQITETRRKSKELLQRKNNEIAQETVCESTLSHDDDEDAYAHANLNLLLMMMTAVMHHNQILIAAMQLSNDCRLR